MVFYQRLKKKKKKNFFFFLIRERSMELKTSTYHMSTFVLIKIANNCALAARARLKEGEGHSKIEKDLVKYYFDK